MKKRLIKTCLLSMICLGFGWLQAQSFGIIGGFSSSTILDKDDEETYSDDYDALAGFHAGLMYTTSITEIFTLDAAIIYSRKGTEINLEEDGNTSKTELRLSYLDIPVTFKLNLAAGEVIRVFGGAGGYAGVGLHGDIEQKIISPATGQTITNKNDIKWGNDADDHLLRMDYGLTFTVGAALSSLQLSFSYDHGLTNIASDQSFDTTVKNRVARLSLGLWF